MSGTAAFDCPRCGVALVMSERQGVEIDYCPQCRGVWLDRGELDKVIERAEAQAAPRAQPQPGAPAGGWTQPSAPPPPQGGARRGDDYRGDDYRHENRGDRDQYGKKRKSWLGELFD